ncbi:hypothetical protein [Amycolatopsis sp. 195334CR]|uniref:hypothetical protein n=1 Tax=Amycolatopsis sp. 195334CR TaxID=2814588 RepID=UPI001A8E3F7E|nr:hypothetical protein [Amycolatopsis sp. 195334CR]MBN6037193.1 hypothetical protein [Amycolatopsis sp. 195334CR]
MTSGANFDTQSQAEKQGGAPPPPPAAGDAGNSFLDNLFAVDPFDEESVKQFTADTQQLKDWADAGPGNGGFAINEEGGQRYLDMCDRYLDGFGNIQARFHELLQRPKLGMSPYAQRVGDHDLKVADGDDASLLPNLEELKLGFQNFRDAIEIARSKYQEKDAEFDQKFRGIDSE